MPLYCGGIGAFDRIPKCKILLYDLKLQISRNKRILRSLATVHTIIQTEVFVINRHKISPDKNDRRYYSTPQDSIEAVERIFIRFYIISDCFLLCKKMCSRDSLPRNSMILSFHTVSVIDFPALHDTGDRRKPVP